MQRSLLHRVEKAGQVIAGFGIYGVVWLNEELEAVNRFGKLVDFVELGKPITDSVLPLIGLENEIRGLQQNPSRILELPAVAVASANGNSKKMNFTFLWLADEQCPVMLAYRSNSQTELELELSKQIRARLMAEEVITAKSKELTRANADLESYAAIISHDLKGPLRHMRFIADDVIAECAERGDESLVKKLAEIQQLSRRMSHMLSELLDYASLGRKYEGLAQTDTRALVESITRSIGEKGFEAQVDGSWPVIATLAAPLDLILRNLIQNAQKHHDGSTGRIRVSCSDEASALVFTVADDGPGIDPAHHQAVFLPFRAMGNSGGTGLGLAMVKKMAESVGGSIKLNSDPAECRGTTFTLYWPKYIVT
jgi:signal transduction histidine kinase